MVQHSHYLIVPLNPKSSSRVPSIIEPLIHRRKTRTSSSYFSTCRIRITSNMDSLQRTVPSSILKRKRPHFNFNSSNTNLFPLSSLVIVISRISDIKLSSWKIIVPSNISSHVITTTSRNRNVTRNNKLCFMSTVWF